MSVHVGGGGGAMGNEESCERHSLFSCFFFLFSSVFSLALRVDR